MDPGRPRPRTRRNNLPADQGPQALHPKARPPRRAGVHGHRTNKATEVEQAWEGESHCRDFSPRHRPTEWVGKTDKYKVVSLRESFPYLDEDAKDWANTCPRKNSETCS